MLKDPSPIITFLFLKKIGFNVEKFKCGLIFDFLEKEPVGGGYNLYLWIFSNNVFIFCKLLLILFEELEIFIIFLNWIKN